MGQDRWESSGSELRTEAPIGNRHDARGKQICRAFNIISITCPHVYLVNDMVLHVLRKNIRLDINDVRL